MLIAALKWLFTVILFIDSDWNYTSIIIILKNSEAFLLIRRIILLI